MSYLSRLVLNRAQLLITSPGTPVRLQIWSNGNEWDVYNCCMTRKLLNPKMKQSLLQYAKDQAIKDRRLNGEYIFGNFSLLINFERCEAQEPHIDLLLPNWQFGLVLTDNAPGTRFAERCAYVRTVADLKTSLKKRCYATIRPYCIDRYR